MKYTITDTHTHLYSEQFDADRNQMIQRALNNGVSRFFIPAIDSTYTESMFALKNAFPENVFLMNGLHPCSVTTNYQNELLHTEQLMQKHSFCAIGEIGIDLYWDKTFLKEQQLVFEHQIRLAKRHSLPIVIHCREAFDAVFEILEQENDEKLFGIFHCFSGNEQQAWKAISYRMKLGIGGVVTYKNGKITDFLHRIPLQHIVTETDAPYLAPVPFRGKRNESAFITKVVEKLSDIYQISESEIARITTENSKEIFGI